MLNNSRNFLTKIYFKYQNNTQNKQENKNFPWSLNESPNIIIIKAQSWEY